MKRFLTSLFLIISVTLLAQKGSVKGFVYDKANGEAVAFATVKIEGTDFGASSDDQGFFNIPNIATGNYKIAVSYIGYEVQTQEIEIVKGKTDFVCQNLMILLFKLLSLLSTFAPWLIKNFFFWMHMRSFIVRTLRSPKIHESIQRESILLFRLFLQIRCWR